MGWCNLKPVLKAPGSPLKLLYKIMNCFQVWFSVSTCAPTYRHKTPNHPHTNMAKAALNMMTRTSAAELAFRHRIFMTAVWPGDHIGVTLFGQMTIFVKACFVRSPHLHDGGRTPG